jgi:hypothetical protein
MFGQPNFKFIVGAAPVESEKIEKARKRAEKIAGTWWLIVPALSIVVPGFGFGVALASGSIYLSIIVSLGLAAFFVDWFSGVEAAASQLSEISIENAEEALRLCSQYPELDAWRAAIVEKRTMVQGELNAMRGYDIVASHAKHKQKRIDEQKNAFAKLHEKNLPTQ